MGLRERWLGAIKRFLSSPYFHLIELVMAFLALVGAFVIFSWEREVKQLRIVFLGTTSLVKVEKSIEEDIEMTYRGLPITSLSLVQVRIENAGNQTIRETEYSVPIKFEFPSQTEIVGPVEVECNFSGSEISVQTEQNIATLPSVMLNEGDQMTIGFLLVNMPVDTSTPPYGVVGRIEGGKVTTADAASAQREDIPSPVVIVIFAVIAFTFGLFIGKNSRLSVMSRLG